MEQPKNDEHFMRLALAEAQHAFEQDEVPVGAVIVARNQVIARAHNLCERLNDFTAHAEMQAFTAASEFLGGKHLDQCTLYVTLEPCPMCAGAIVHCRPDRVVFGCPDAKGGAAGGWINLLESNPPLNHRCDIVAGVLQDECVALLQSFFREARDRKKAERDLIRKQAEEG